jgi:hypothetical protein
MFLCCLMYLEIMSLRIIYNRGLFYFLTRHYSLQSHPNDPIQPSASVGIPSGPIHIVTRSLFITEAIVDYVQC